LGAEDPEQLAKASLEAALFHAYCHTNWYRIMGTPE
jgi:hypothetical protein